MTGVTAISKMIAIWTEVRIGSILGALFRLDKYLLPYSVLVRDTIRVLPRIIAMNRILLAILYVLPVSYVLDTKYRVATEY